jgi:hypothetical protein
MRGAEAATFLHGKGGLIEVPNLNDNLERFGQSIIVN